MSPGGGGKRLERALGLRWKNSAEAAVLYYTLSRREARMRIKRFSRIQWLFAGAFALALAAPAMAGAKSNPNLVQIGGELVPPAQVSEWQATADLPRIPHVVQIGGELVAPSQVSDWQANADLPQIPRFVQIGGELVLPPEASAWQHDVGALRSSTASSQRGDSGFTWSDAGVTVGAAFVLLLVAASMVVVRRRGTTALRGT